MELRPYIKGALRLPAEAVRMPLGITKATVERVGDYALQAFDDTLEIFAPKQSPEEFVEERKKLHALDDAHIAHKAIERSKKNDDPELYFFARASLIKALSWAYKSKEVPPRVTKEVVQIVHEHEVLMPELEPLVPEEDILPAKKAILKYSETGVLEVFPSGQDTV